MLKKNIQFLFCFLFLSSCFLFAQDKHNNIWYFGKNSGLDFNSGTPVVLTDGQTNTVEGVASIADTNGNLLFYTDGNKIWNKTHVVMSNSGGLNGHASSTQAALILPKPGSKTIYYVFTTDQLIGGNGLCYSEVDMTLSAGLGKVTANKNIQLIAPTDEKVTATQHANGRDFWVITHKLLTDKYYVFLVDTSGVNLTPVISVTGTDYKKDDGRGYLKISKCGTRLASGLSESNSVDVLSFDRLTGSVKFDFSIPASILFYVYGVEFSPDGSKLYVSYAMDKEIYQFDLSLGNTAAILASQVKVGTTVGGAEIAGMQIGPDDKIYVAKQPFTNIAVINQPNVAGTGCNFQDAVIALSGTCNYAFPNNVQYIPGNLTLTSDSIKNPSCKGYSNGYASIKASGSSGNLFYSWAPNVSNTYFCNSLSAGTYTITVTDTGNACSSAFQSIIITLSDPPGATTSDTVSPSVCGKANGLIQVNVSGGAAPHQIVWNTGDTTFTLNGLVAGNYNYTVTDMNGCKYSDTLALTATASTLKIAGIKDTSLCKGEPVKFKPVLGGGNAPYHFDWENGQPSVDSLIVSAISDTIIHLIITDNVGCKDSASATITLLSAALATTSGNKEICLGDSINISASGGDTYQWSPTAGLNNPSISSPISTPTTTTTFTVTVSKGSCPSDTATVTVKVVPFITADAGIDQTICLGDSLQLIAGGGSNYQWLPNTSLSNINVSNPFAFPTVSTSYTVIVTSGSCAPDSDVVMINVVQGAVAYASNDTVICTGNPITLNASGGTLYSWSPTVQNTSSFTVTPGQTTIYTVTVSIGSCPPDTETVLVTVFPSPDVIIVQTPSVSTIQEGDQITLAGLGAKSYTWTPTNSLSDSSGSSVIASPKQTTTYTVTGTDEFGCKADYSITIYVIENCGTPFLPTAFSPNNDGANDNLKLSTLNYDCIQSYHLVIYNRWGEKVFETSNPKQAWDGAYKGVACDAGTFDYFLNIVLVNDEEINETGNIYIIL